MKERKEIENDEKMSRNIEKKLEQNEIDVKTPKSKFKCVLRKFGNEIDEKENDEKEVKDEKEAKKKKMKGDIIDVLNPLGERKKGRLMGTLLPSSVSSQKESAAARAQGDQFFDVFRPGDMSRGSIGPKKEINRKRKLNLTDENAKIDDYFSPKKLPKLTNENIFLSRLGSPPGEGDLH